MDTAKSISNASYSVLKKKPGLHNWGFLTTRENFELDADELEDFYENALSREADEA